MVRRLDLCAVGLGYRIAIVRAQMPLAWRIWKDREGRHGVSCSLVSDDGSWIRLSQACLVRKGADLPRLAVPTVRNAVAREERPGVDGRLPVL